MSYASSQWSPGSPVEPAPLPVLGPLPWVDGHAWCVRGERGEPPRKGGKVDCSEYMLYQTRLLLRAAGRGKSHHIPGFQASLGLHFFLQNERTGLYSVPSCTYDLVYLDLVVLGLG